MADKKPDTMETAEPDTVMSKQELLNLMAAPREISVVDGLKLRGLSGSEYEMLKVMRITGAQSARAKGVDTQQAFQSAETLAWLQLGVIEPVLTETEWRNLLGTVSAGRIDNWVTAIRELSGIEEMEVQLAKKALGRMPLD
jgi:hypothetical protein